MQRLLSATLIMFVTVQIAYRREICEWDEKRPSYLPVDGTTCPRLRALEYDLASEAFLRSKFAY